MKFQISKNNVQNYALPDSVDLGPLDGVLVLIGLACLFSSNPAESLFAIAQLKLLLRAYWRKGLPPVVLMLFLIPWLEISTSILEANLRLETLNAMLHGSGRAAYWCSSIGLLAVHAGAYPFFRRHKNHDYERLKSSATNISLPKAIGLYFLILLSTNSIAGFLGWGSSLYQIVTYFNQISQVLLIVICCRQALLNEFNATFIVFLLIVLFSSFYSFFSDWRILLFAVFISFGTIQKLTLKAVKRGLFIAVVFGNVLYVWQGIKPIYRAYLVTGKVAFRGDIGSQAVNVSRSEALTTFFALSRDFYFDESETYLFDNTTEDTFYATLRRIGYLEFMSLTMNRVPEVLDHEKGDLLQSNLTYALIPRILNPTKSIKDDGAKVEKYANFKVADSASFSLGHYVEYYIDYGKSGMQILLFLFGVLGGCILLVSYRSATIQSPLFHIGLVFVILQNWGSFQNDAIFVFGATFFSCLCHIFIFRPVYIVLIKLSASNS
jgi:hypothetical protein